MAVDARERCRNTSPDGRVIVMSYGADGRHGGTGEDSDITSEH
jgi:hypothetical protein